MSIVYLAFILCALYKIGVEADFHVYLEDFWVEYLNSEYFDDGSNGFIDDDTVTTNFTVLKALPIDSDVHFELTGLSMGKYTLPTGLDVQMPLCEVENEPILLGPFFGRLGFFAKGCPPPAGNYFQEGYTMPMENMPDDFPNNKYQTIFEITHNDEPLFAIRIYADVQS